MGLAQPLREAGSFDNDPIRIKRPLRRSPVKLSLWSRWVFYLMVAALHLVSLLPDGLLRLLGAVGGMLGYALDRRHIKIGLKNLAIAFPHQSEAERRRLLKASYRNLGLAGAEYIRLAGFFHLRLKRRVSYEHLDYLEGLKRQNPACGIVILTAHFGNFELLPAAHALHGYQISLVHHTQRFLAGDALMTWVRERAGVEIIRKHSAARAVLRALKEGEIIGIPFDQNAKRSEAIFVPFFGEPAATTSGVARLAQISQALVVPAFLVRQPDRRSHHVVIGEQIALQRSGDASADIEENTRRFVRAVEDAARQYPEQFLWTHRRFRTRPRGAAPVYD